VGALLVRTEVDHALELGREKLLGAVVAQADHLLYAGNPDAREAQLYDGLLRLDIDYLDALHQKKGRGVDHWGADEAATALSTLVRPVTKSRNVVSLRASHGECEE
jgi:hypothetical protein